MGVIELPSTSWDQYEGRTTRQSLTMSDPFPREQCERGDCPLKTPTGCATRCYNSNINYQYTCNRCEHEVERREQYVRAHEEEPQEGESGETSQPTVPQYRGESSRTLLTRHRGHMSDYSREEMSGFMWAHTMDTHHGAEGIHP